VKNLFPRFSHIYIEREAYDYPLSDFVLSKFHNSSIIDIKHYKDIFNRPGQDFQTQKASMKLILAKKPDPFLYPVTDMVQGHHISEFYYTTPMLNCLYNCDYCFLQGMYPSGNIVIFVNQDDLQNAIINKIDQKNSSQRMITVSISYNTDLLAMENFFPLTKSWIDFASNKSNLMIEIRTKSSDFASIKNISPNLNISSNRKYPRSGAFEIEINGKNHEISGSGNGPIDAFVNALNQKLSIDIKVSDYHQSAISSGSDAQAAAYIELQKGDKTSWGVGINPNTTKASFEAIIVGVAKLI